MRTEQLNMQLLNAMQNDMMQSVVHDLRTPMTVIKGYLQLLISGGMGEMASDQMAVLRRSVAPLEDLILLTDNLLQSASLQNGKVELNLSPVDLDRILAETIEFYQLTFQQRKMRIFREGNTVGVKMLVDPFWFKRVLNNLVWNAFKFTPDGGQVTFDVSHKEDGGIEIGVKDSGRGIPSDRIEKIFEKFEQNQSNDRKVGNGLGLWICRRVLELHGGHISVKSTEGQGSRFSLLLPADRLL